MSGLTEWQWRQRTWGLLASNCAWPDVRGQRVTTCHEPAAGETEAPGTAAAPCPPRRAAARPPPLLVCECGNGGREAACVTLSGQRREGRAHRPGNGGGGGRAVLEPHGDRRAGAAGAEANSPLWGRPLPPSPGRRPPRRPTRPRSRSSLRP